jgi:hypothetical protein
MGENRNACRILVGKSEEKRPIGRLRHMWRIFLKLIVERGDGVERTGLICLG